MSVAQGYLEKMAAEHQAAIDAIEAERLAEEKEREAGRRKEYDLIVDKMPVELAEYYSFDPSHRYCPLKISIPEHVDIYVGMRERSLRYAIGKDEAERGHLSGVLDRAKRRYREPKPVVSPQPVAPKPEEPSFLEHANKALDSFSYEKAMAFALVEIAHQLSEIDKTLVSMNSL